MAGTVDDDAAAHRSRRVEAAFRVRYRSIDELSLALTHDLARRSLFMCTSRELQVDSLVRVYLELPEGIGTIPLVGRIAFVRPEDEATRSGKPAGVGLELVDLTLDQLASLERLVAECRARPPTQHDRGPLDIVVADDDTSLRQRVAAALRSRGDRVREAGDGLEALGACLNEPPDLLLSDVQMPRMDGWQLLRILRARSSLVHVPIVLLTTLADDKARLEGYRLGVDDYIGKPVPDDVLTSRIDRVVARARESAPQRPALRGDLEHVALASVLSFLSMERKTGILEVVADASARMYLRGGELLRVDVDDVPTSRADDPALRALFTWSRGRFEFSQQNVVCDDELHTTVSALLLEQRLSSNENQD